MIKTGFIIAAVGALPLLLYAAVGPADGNPVGLGLLFITATPLGLLVLAIGLIRALL